MLEVLEGPTTEDGANLQRVKCHSVQDDAVAWVTIAGNQGTAFLEPFSKCVFVCVKETVITEGLEVADSKTVRTLKEGEIVEVLEFPQKGLNDLLKMLEASGQDVKRVKAKAKSDGARGWMTVKSNNDTVFLQLQ